MRWKALSLAEKKSLYINPNNKEDIKIVTLHSVKFINMKNLIKKTPWSESASKLYRPSERRLSAK
jgi:hypothetical protein